MSGAPRREGGPDRAALVIAALLALVAVAIYWQTSGMRVAGQHTKVGPTTLPYLVAAALALLAVGHVFSAFRHGFPARDADRLPPMLWIVGGLVLQMLLLRTAGFSIATGVMFAFAVKGFGRGPLWMTIPVGVAFSLAVWLVFSGLLKLSLPAGPLEHLFF